MNKRLSHWDWIVIAVASVAGVGLAVWFVLSDSPWPIGIALAGIWLVSIVYRRHAGVLFWLVFVAATVPVVIWLLGYGGVGLLAIFVILNAVAMAVGKPRRAVNGSA